MKREIIFDEGPRGTAGSAESVKGRRTARKWGQVKWKGMRGEELARRVEIRVARGA